MSSSAGDKPQLASPPPLRRPERERLVMLEERIERGRQAFIDVGEALSEIRDQRLYRETHTTFEDYLSERWGMSRRHGYRALEAFSVARNVPSMTRERLSATHLSALAPLPPERQAEVAERVVDEGLSVRQTRDIVTSEDENIVDAEWTVVEENTPEPGRPSEADERPRAVVATVFNQLGFAHRAVRFATERIPENGLRDVERAAIEERLDAVLREVREAKETIRRIPRVEVRRRRPEAIRAKLEEFRAKQAAERAEFNETIEREFEEWKESSEPPPSNDAYAAAILSPVLDPSTPYAGSQTP